MVRKLLVRYGDHEDVTDDVHDDDGDGDGDDDDNENDNVDDDYDVDVQNDNVDDDNVDDGNVDEVDLDDNVDEDILLLMVMMTTTEQLRKVLQNYAHHFEDWNGTVGDPDRITQEIFCCRLGFYMRL